MNEREYRKEHPLSERDTANFQSDKERGIEITRMIQIRGQ